MWSTPAMNTLPLLFLLVSMTEAGRFTLVLRVSDPTPVHLRFIDEEGHSRAFRHGFLRLDLDSIPDVWEERLEFRDGLEIPVKLRPRREKNALPVDVNGHFLLLQYQIECARHFFGPSCSVRCVSEEDGGHYSCGPQGERLCHNGWGGKDCSRPATACDRNPCINGSCEYEGDAFRCVCHKGFTGMICASREESTTTSRTTVAKTTTSPSLTTPKTTQKTTKVKTTVTTTTHSTTSSETTQKSTTAAARTTTTQSTTVSSETTQKTTTVPPRSASSEATTEMNHMISVTESYKFSWGAFLLGGSTVTIFYICVVATGITALVVLRRRQRSTFDSPASGCPSPAPNRPLPFTPTSNRYSNTPTPKSRFPQGSPTSTNTYIEIDGIPQSTTYKHFEEPEFP